MRDMIKDRVEEVALYLIENEGVTIRDIAKKYKVCKSSIHVDLRLRLPEVNEELYEKVNDILENHKENRHIKGGIATRKKWEELKEA